MLEDHADVAPGLAQSGTRLLGEIRAVDRHRARGRTFEAGEAADERRLAGAGATDDAVDLSRGHAQVDLFERDGVAEHLPQTAQVDHGSLLLDSLGWVAGGGLLPRQGAQAPGRGTCADDSACQGV